MKKYTRGEFLGVGATAAAALGLGGAAGPEQQAVANAGEPDLIVVNGRVQTVDADLPRAEAFAVKNGYFVAVGSNDDIRNLATSRTRVMDVGGMFVTPGFIDAHCHPAGGGLSELVNVNLDVRTIGELKDRMHARAQQVPPGEWIVGFKYDDTKCTDETTGRYRRITRQDLDQAVPDHPVVVHHRGGHIAWYNSAAFRLAGITVETPDPSGGKIYRENGALTGLVAERANDLFDGLIPSGSTRDQRRQGVALISKLMTAAGLTSVHDAATGVDSVIAYQDAYHAGEMRFRAYMMITGPEDGFKGLEAAGIYTGMGDRRLRVGGVKFFADGSCSGRTMAMSTPYEGRPDDYGILTMTQEETNERVEDAHRHDFQIGIHANGDVAIDMVLTAYERAQRLHPRRDPRFRLEHCTLVNPDLLRRIKALNAIPTPFWTYCHYNGNKWAEYGQEKLRWMFAHRSFLDYGIPVAGASDYVPGPFEPLMAIQSMVTRKDMAGRVWGPNQKISVDEAITIGTINGAHASFEEGLKGSITSGKLADFVVFAEDPHDVDPDTIKNIEVVRTVVEGETVHEA